MASITSKFPGQSCVECGHEFVPGQTEIVVHPSKRGPKGGKKYVHANPGECAARSNPRSRSRKNRAKTRYTRAYVEGYESAKRLRDHYDDEVIAQLNVRAAMNAAERAGLRHRMFIGESDWDDGFRSGLTLVKDQAQAMIGGLGGIRSVMPRGNPRYSKGYVAGYQSAAQLLDHYDDEVIAQLNNMAALNAAHRAGLRSRRFKDDPQWEEGFFVGLGPVQDRARAMTGSLGGIRSVMPRMNPRSRRNAGRRTSRGAQKSGRMDRMAEIDFLPPASSGPAPFHREDARSLSSRQLANMSEPWAKQELRRRGRDSDGVKLAWKAKSNPPKGRAAGFFGRHPGGSYAGISGAKDTDGRRERVQRRRAGRKQIAAEMMDMRNESYRRKPLAGRSRGSMKTSKTRNELLVDYDHEFGMLRELQEDALREMGFPHPQELERNRGIRKGHIQALLVEIRKLPEDHFPDGYFREIAEGL